MRYAICSDIHANLQAWNAVLIDARSMGVDRIICLGDIVGYGPNPREVLESVHAKVHFMVMGNHDAAMCGLLDASLFNDTALEVLDWQKGELGPDALSFLKEFPLSLAGDGFRCTHAEFSDPGCFEYVIAAEDAEPSFEAVEESLLLVGHTHVPGLFVTGDSGAVHCMAPQDFEMEDGKRYLVNVGSVGQPRDGDLRASYCVYDTDRHAILWRRIPFDIDAFRAAIRDAGIPDAAAKFLDRDPRKQAPLLREEMNFRPPQSRKDGARGVREVQDLAELQVRVKKWKGATWALLVLTLALLGGGFFAWYRHATRDLRIDHTRGHVVDATKAATGDNLLPVIAGSSGPGLHGWRLRLGNKRRQLLSLEGNIVTLTSETVEEEVELSSPVISVDDDMKLQLSAMIKPSPSYAGTIAVVISVTRDDGSELNQYVVKEPTTRRREGWLLAQKTFELPAGARRVRFYIRGKFSGSVEIRDLALGRK